MKKELSDSRTSVREGKRRKRGRKGGKGLFGLIEPQQDGEGEKGGPLVSEGGKKKK